MQHVARTTLRVLADLEEQLDAALDAQPERKAQRNGTDTGKTFSLR
jgi:hypothetical protein